MQSTTISISELAEKLNARLIGEGTLDVGKVNTLDAAGPTDVTFLTAEKFAEKALSTKAAAIITAAELKTSAPAQLIVDEPQAALIKALYIFAPRLEVTPGVHKTAVIDDSAQLGDNVSIGPNAVIGKNVVIGENTIIGPGCTIEEGTAIGSNSRLGPSVTIYHSCKIGDNCTIKANSTIGGTGYGYYFLDGQHRLVPHNGSVVIEDCVDIGSNTCIDRAKFGNTIVGAGTKIDNMVQIAHNCEIGRCCLIAGCTGIAGSVKIRDGAVLGGQTGVVDNVTIGPGAMLGAKTMAISDLEGGKSYFGSPAEDARASLKQTAAVKKLPEIIKQFKKLAKRVDKLESSKDN
ncbi:UDP-3-O-acylglucosamine N-acyltransferase [Anaerohalosphaera lusitana]|uniref:UDP-3-O-acylglucosamine N-acyltransferase n=1 Tax=Anaerohalosphaera lusitana TaxID=1936003 RepID=A0A1U9NHQ7_9BACT|nr:UDP-3-O-(3-hydroxymyristoyl)glucosamine N-acyltransferase [Anaerohalosphaera lusitana]AQT67335.1 UDP-3-O-acylglucosamine N-acyltransferase [Anaerohalosphaera lusitana]